MPAVAATVPHLNLRANSGRLAATLTGIAVVWASLAAADTTGGARQPHPQCQVKAHNNTWFRTNTGSVSAVHADNYSECCALCATPPCVTWSFGWNTTVSGAITSTGAAHQRAPGKPELNCHLHSGPTSAVSQKDGVVSGSMLPLPPPPPPHPMRGQCKTCADWCYTNCSFPPPAGSVALNDGSGAHKMTVVRMTPSNLTDILNKDTGDYAGDIAFTLMELAMPMKCRHDPTNSDCQSTHGWLMRSNLVYAQHEIVARVWGPYQPCNIDPKHPSGNFKCEGARPPVALKDAAVCATCPRTDRHAGWDPLELWANSSSAPPHISQHCNETATKLCGAAAARGRGACEVCADAEANQAALNRTCGGKAYPGAKAVVGAFCPPMRPLDKTCEAAAQRLCGSDAHRWAERAECFACAKVNNATLLAAGCPTDMLPRYGYVLNVCEKPVPSGKGSPYTADIKLMGKIAGGSWFSTPNLTKCDDGRALDTVNTHGNNCTWVDHGITKVANFSCVNSGLNRAVRAKNMTCFGACPDGGQVYPVDASDCWLDCYYRIVSGGTYGQYGAPQISRAEMIAAWSQGLKSSNVAAGGCPALPPDTPLGGRAPLVDRAQ